MSDPMKPRARDDAVTPERSPGTPRASATPQYDDGNNKNTRRTIAGLAGLTGFCSVGFPEETLRLIPQIPQSCHVVVVAADEPQASSASLEYPRCLAPAPEKMPSGFLAVSRYSAQVVTDAAL